MKKLLLVIFLLSTPLLAAAEITNDGALKAAATTDCGFGPLDINFGRRWF